jgi:hypothetical protein
LVELLVREMSKFFSALSAPLAFPFSIIGEKDHVQGRDLRANSKSFRLMGSTFLVVCQRNACGAAKISHLMPRGEDHDWRWTLQRL